MLEGLVEKLEYESSKLYQEVLNLRKENEKYKQERRSENNGSWGIYEINKLFVLYRKHKGERSWPYTKKQKLPRQE